ncbi:MAG TPA: hypothetical protein VKT78_12245 [Fimbriimonadaceae bacterium]|nr:hypothetical protein [Fimbriimonadaceae bacterium]
MAAHLEHVKRFQKRHFAFIGFLFASAAVGFVVALARRDLHFGKVVVTAYFLVLLLVYFPWRFFEAAKLDALRKKELASYNEVDAFQAKEHDELHR